MYTTDIGDRRAKVFIQQQDIKTIATRKFFKVRFDLINLLLELKVKKVGCRGCLIKIIYSLLINKALLDLIIY